MGMRIFGSTVAIGFMLAVLFSETLRAWVLIFMLLVSLAGFVRFLFSNRLGQLLTGLAGGGLFGCSGDE